MRSSKQTLCAAASLQKAVPPGFCRVVLVGVALALLAATLPAPAGAAGNDDPAKDASQPKAVEPSKELPPKPEPVPETQLLLEKIANLEARVAELEAARS
ncbi:MAG TPA: hypothetical protein VMD78_16335, partial [Candidatus Baltobacteraceae bacterium]|nr:hypothetical protein [Candidatus Baltobacteraceae bacterium]